MKIIKLIFKLIIVLIIPYLIQIITFAGYGMYQGIVAAMNGQSADVIAAELTDKILSATPYILLISSLIVIGIFYLVHISKKRPSMKEAYRFKSLKSNHLMFTIGLGLLVFSFSIALSGLFDLASLDPEAAESLSALVLNDAMLLTIITVGIIVPISEEIVFRGSVFKNLSEHVPVVWAIIIQAGIFSVYHFNLVQAFPTLIIGLIIGFAVYYTGSIYAGIIIHMINNSLAVGLSYILPDDFLLTPMMNILVLIVAGSLLLFTLKKLHTSRVQFQTNDEL